ncbi:Retrovirus-related Pol polyprotein from transposon 17.6 [Lamellibrachia satsuma]|nr:Retrovirus-related Pol polyprotein from transposon 17.6 [Lamellibrachia satsuma]
MITTLTLTRDITDHGKHNIEDPRTPCAISACIDIRLSVFVETADIDKIYEDLMQQGLGHGHEESIWEGGPVPDPIDIWIPNNINKRMCCTYIPQEGASDTCECGHPDDAHHESGDERRWETAKTDAYGEIKFADERTGKYVRIDHETHMDTVETLLMKYWKIKQPEVLISVTGDEQDVPMLPSLKDMLSRLVDAAHSTGAWIITGGMQKGFTEIIGEAVRVRVAGDGNEAGLVVIGIATWGCVYRKDSLVKDDGSWPAEYKDNVETTETSSPLDPNHSHFLLVDNGTQHKYGGEIEFRTKLEKHLSKKHMNVEAIERERSFTYEPTESLEDPECLKRKFRDICNPRTNIILERHRFNCRVQQRGESIQTFLSDLKIRSISCQYGELADSLIRDRIVTGIINDGVRRLLLRESNLILAKAMQICQIHELSEQDAKAMQPPKVEADTVKQHRFAEKKWQNRQSTNVDIVMARPGSSVALIKNNITTAEVDKNVTTLLGLKDCIRLELITLSADVHELSHAEQIAEHKLPPGILQEYSDLFDNTLGKLPVKYKITIDPSITPVIRPVRSVPVALKQKLKSELEVMVEKGIITPVNEPTDWVSALVVVKKKDTNGIHICMDPGELNRAIKRPHYLMRTTEEVVENIPNAKYFTVMDAKQAFYHIPLENDSSYLTTFGTPFGRFRYLRMPMGISSASEVYQRGIEHLLAGYPCAVIMDDILVSGASEMEHDANLEKVLNRLREINLKLSPRKCKYKLQEIPYIGHVLSKDGLKPHPRKVQAITEKPEPENTTDLLRFILTCDASQHGLGAACLQNGRPVAYASRALTETETRYAQIEKELLAVVFACTKFKNYICAVTVETDHQPLISITKKPLSAAPARLQRMLMRLQSHDIHLVYRKVKDLVLADALSRAYLHTEQQENEEVTDYEVLSLLPITSNKLDELKQATAADNSLQRVYRAIQSDWPTQSKHIHPELKP